MTNTLHIYTRVSSTIQQEEGTSLENQKQLGIRKAAELGVDYKLWNEGGQSSFFDDLNNRPVLVNLLMLIETGSVKHLFVYNADRLSRNQQTWAVIRFKLLKHGVTLHTVSGQMKLKNPVDDLMLGILSEISQYDNRIRSERSRMGRFQKIQQGSWKGGPPPFGYRLVDKKLSIDEFESGWVNKIFDWYSMGISVKNIQGRLMAEGVVTRRGNKHWSLGSIDLILRNSVYAGYYEYTDKMMAQTVRIDTPTIIEPVMFDTVQNKRKVSNSRKHQVNPTKHFYLLRDFLVCGHCGSPMGGRINKSGNQNLYYCVKKERSWVNRGDDHPKWQRGCNCSMVRSINIARTDKMVWDIAVGTLDDIWNTPCNVDEQLSILFVGFDEVNQTTPEVVDGDSQTDCGNGGGIDSDCCVHGGVRTDDIGITPIDDIAGKFPATFDYIQHRTSTPDPCPDDKKAILTELVDTITVHFDKTANKHRIDVAFIPNIEARLREISAKSAVAGVVVPVCEVLLAADCAGNGQGDCQLPSKKPGNS